MGPLVCCGREECNQCVMLPLVFCRGNLPFSLSGEHALLLRKKGQILSEVTKEHIIKTEELILSGGNPYLIYILILDKTLLY